jgi:tRNA(Ile2) C34 agmatinyltransferase TiaS
MTKTLQEKFIKAIIKIIDRWSFEQCAFCEDGTMVSIEGMLDYKCSRCGKTMNPVNYLVEIARIVLDYREQFENEIDNK